MRDCKSRSRCWSDVNQYSDVGEAIQRSGSGWLLLFLSRFATLEMR